MQQDVAETQKKLGLGEQAQSGIGTATMMAGMGQMIGGPNGGVGALGAVAGMATKAFLPLAIVSQIISLAQTVLDSMLKPGGILDRRFRREARMESANLTNLKDKQEYSYGKRVVRVTTIGSQRGTNSQSRSNLDYIKNGVDIYDIHGVFNKGIGAGTI